MNSTISQLYCSTVYVQGVCFVTSQAFQILVRDMYAFYPLLIKYVDLHRSTWLKEPNPVAETLYVCVAEVFNLWSKSHVRC